MGIGGPSPVAYGFSSTSSNYLLSHPAPPRRFRGSFLTTAAAMFVSRIFPPAALDRPESALRPVFLCRLGGRGCAQVLVGWADVLPVTRLTGLPVLAAGRYPRGPSWLHSRLPVSGVTHAGPRGCEVAILGGGYRLPTSWIGWDLKAVDVGRVEARSSSFRGVRATETRAACSRRATERGSCAGGPLRGQLPKTRPFAGQTAPGVSLSPSGSPTGGVWAG